MNFLTSKVSRFALLALLVGGCNYYEETTIDEEEAPDASGDDSGMRTKNGSARSLVLTRGVSLQPVGCGNAAENETGGVYTVQFEIFPSAPLPVNIPSTIAYAIVKWTVGGQDIQRVLNISNGAALAGVGGGATIQVYDATAPQSNAVAALIGIPIGTPVKDGRQYTVTCTIGDGTRGSNINPPSFFPSFLDRYTGVASYGVLEPNFADTVIPIPQGIGATSFQIQTTPVTGVGLTRFTDLGAAVAQIDNTGFAIKAWNSLEYADGWIPLDPSAVSINISNLNTGGGQEITYGVAFGIDG